MAVDIGGTFTDVCTFDDRDGTTRVGKVSSTKDPIDAVFDGIRAVGVEMGEIGLFSHGTTVATNALITRSFPRAAMITTKGFRDVIEIRRGTRQDLWDAYKDVAPPYIRRRDRFEITERVDYSGQELDAVDEEELRRVAHLIRRRGIETVAVCLVNSHANPEHEQRVKAVLAEVLPGVSVSTSSEVLPEIFEHERFSTTVANAVLSPLVGSYAKRLGERMKTDGYEGDVLLLHSGGGVMTTEAVERLGGRLASSGLAAGARARRRCSLPTPTGLLLGIVVRSPSTITGVVRPAAPSLVLVAGLPLARSSVLPEGTSDAAAFGRRPRPGPPPARCFRRAVPRRSRSVPISGGGAGALDAPRTVRPRTRGRRLTVRRPCCPLRVGRRSRPASRRRDSA